MCWMKLNSRTTTKKTWDMIRKINGKGKPPLRHLEANNTALEAPRDIADALAETFCKKSSSANYSEKFQRNKTREEKKKNLISILLIQSIIINSSPLKN